MVALKALNRLTDVIVAGTAPGQAMMCPSRIMPSRKRDVAAVDRQLVVVFTALSHRPKEGKCENDDPLHPIESAYPYGGSNRRPIFLTVSFRQSVRGSLELVPDDEPFSSNRQTGTLHQHSVNNKNRDAPTSSF